MYSLYRAWFGGNGTEDNFTRSRESLSPPDTVIRVGNEGEHQFVAHKGVLAAHSGYLKALLSGGNSIGNNATDTSEGASNSNRNSGDGSSRQQVTSVSVSSIGGEAFAPLLNYMYTGRLEVTLDNVYSVLLATHLLHMPGALEQCRAALLRLRAQPPIPTPLGIPGPEATTTSSANAGRILRPIPNRPMIGPPLCWPQPPPPPPPPPPPSHLYSSTGGITHLSHLPTLQPAGMLIQSTVPPGISVIPTSLVQDESSARREESQRQIPETTMMSSQGMTSVSIPFVTAFTAFAAASNVPNQTTGTGSPSISASSSPSLSPVSPPSSPISRSPTFRRNSGSAVTAQNIHRPSKRRRDKTEREFGNQQPTDEECEQRQSQQCRSRESFQSHSQNHREKSRESSSGRETDRARLSKRRGRSNSVNEESSVSGAGANDVAGASSVVYDVACCDGPVRFHRVLNENYSSTRGRTGSSPRPCIDLPENDENDGQSPSDAGGIATGEANSPSYTCGYCRHTFKSQYCYRKHAKRHLLPTATNREEDSGNRQRRENPRTSSREVKLLDLNVQYYPCKICGCKFPSYYFVHKHRKLCHSSVEEAARSNVDEVESNEQEQPSRTSYESTTDATGKMDRRATSVEMDSN